MPQTIAANLERAFSLLENLLRERLAVHFGQLDAVDLSGFEAMDWPVLKGGGPALSAEEKILLTTALAAHVQPTFFGQQIQRLLPEPGDFPELGGVRGAQSRAILPTGETVIFLLAGASDLAARLRAQAFFSPEHPFSKKKTCWLDDVPPGEPAMSGRLVMAPETVEWLTTGRAARPRFGLNFPADLVETEMTWDDLVLNPHTRSQVGELATWLDHGQTLLSDPSLKRRLKPGFRALFWGPPGTGKTLTAGLIGKQAGRDVYKIDLSMMVSKFIGETEKNLAGLFDRAEDKDWILFFDEADALFGKRTGIRDAHDKYANQEVSYLLQRVEHFGGLVILASNFKSNIDEAFTRRFQCIVHFPFPKAGERLLLWQKALPESLPLESDVDLGALAAKYELTGASILNVVQLCALRALADGRSALSLDDLLNGIQRELGKEGKQAGG